MANQSRHVPVREKLGAVVLEVLLYFGYVVLWPGRPLARARRTPRQWLWRIMVQGWS